MAQNKGGRKRLGNRKREHRIMLRFNDEELEKVKTMLQSFNLDFNKRGTVGPFLRRFILNKEAEKEDKLPDGFSNLVYQINKIGNNINQLTKVAQYKNLRSPSAKLQSEVEKSNELLLQVMQLLIQKKP